MPTQSLGNYTTGCEGTTLESVLRECFSCGVIAVDLNGHITSLSPEAQRFLRLPALKKRGASVESLPSQITSIIREVLQTGQTAANRQIVLNSFEHEPMTLSVTAMPVSGKHGHSVVAMLNDFTKAGKFDETLRRLDRLATLGTMSASVAHEIKNALVAVKTFVDLLLEKNKDSELTQTVRREISRMNALITNLLKYAAPSQPQFAEVSLHEVLEHSLRLVQPRIGGRLIATNHHFLAARDLFLGDANQLEQAFLNLLFNAVDAMSSEGSLTVSTELVDSGEPAELHDGTAATRQLRVRISDTGVGIPRDRLGAIFDPFFTTKPSGTGLGLTVTKRIIEEHKGFIRVESRPGKGSTFTILLPAAAGEPHSRTKT